MNTIIAIAKYAGPHREFIVLLGILGVSVSVLIFVAKAYWLIVKAHASYLVKQEQCKGKFDITDIKIKNIEVEQQEQKDTINGAVKAVEKIQTCTGKMQKTVEEIQGQICGFADLIEGKYKNAESQKN